MSTFVRRCPRLWEPHDGYGVDDLQLDRRFGRPLWRRHRCERRHHRRDLLGAEHLALAVPSSQLCQRAPLLLASLARPGTELGRLFGRSAATSVPLAAKAIAKQGEALLKLAGL